MIVLGHHVNKPVLVSIPSVFGDDAPRVCTLVGIEASGLWLDGKDLAATLIRDREVAWSGNVFVPFCQVNYLVESVPASTPHPQPRTPPAGERATTAPDKKSKPKRGS